MKGPCIVAIAALLVSAASSPAARRPPEAGAPSGPPFSSGSRFMIAYLDYIARSTDPVLDVYMNRARAAGFSTLLGRPMSDIQEMQLRVKIADELLKGGQTKEAIEMYEYVYREIERRKVPVEESYYRMLRDMLAIAYLRLNEEGKVKKNVR